MSAQDDVAAFAALLRELKERTDRSYGSLARRLHMNTSTLHRYCAGEAVPVDFAPVERFAALCGASPTERLDLHRRWLRAAESRRHPRVTASTRTDTASAKGPSGEVATGTAPNAGGVFGASPDGEVSSGSDAASGGGGEGTAPGKRARGARGGSAKVGRSGSGSGEPAAGHRVDGDPAGVPDTASDGGGVSGPVRAGQGGDRRPRYRRRKRVSVAVAAASVLLATAGSLSTLPDDRQSSAGQEDPGAHPTGTPATTGSAVTPYGRPPSSTPSAEDPGTGPGTGPPQTRPAAPKPRRSPSAPPSSTAPPESTAPDSSPPLAWSADSHVWAYGCGHDYVIARPPRQVPPPPVPQDARTWAEAQSAVHGGETRVELSVQGTSGTAVVLTGLRVRVAGRSAPARGNAYAMDQGCGGALTPRYFDVDLDADRPVARAVAGNNAGTPIPAVTFPYRVSATDPEVLVVTARTGDCDCRWYLELDWSSQGRTGTVRIDDHGRPFRTSGLTDRTRYAYDTSARAWRPRVE